MTSTPFVSAQTADRARPLPPGAPVTAKPIVAAPMEEGDGAFRGLAARPDKARVHGIVKNHLGALVPNAGSIVIRRLEDGEPVGQTRVDALATFSVAGLDAGIYAAELVNSVGAVIATTGAFTAIVGQLVHVAAVIPSEPLTGFASFLASATDGALKSAASVGLMAISTGVSVSAR